MTNPIQSPTPDLVRAAQAVIDDGRQIHGTAFDVSASRFEALRAALAALLPVPQSQNTLGVDLASGAPDVPLQGQLLPCPMCGSVAETLLYEQKEL